MKQYTLKLVVDVQDDVEPETLLRLEHHIEELIDPDSWPEFKGVHDVEVKEVTSVPACTDAPSVRVDDPSETDCSVFFHRMAAKMNGFMYHQLDPLNTAICKRDEILDSVDEAYVMFKAFLSEFDKYLETKMRALFLEHEERAKHK